MRENNDFVSYDEETNLIDKPNIILIGAAGHQGREYFKILKERCNFKALIDSDYELLKKLYEPNKLLLLPDFKELNTIDYDIALICLPHFLHKDITLSLLSSNKMIIKEKPLGFSSSDIKEYHNQMQKYSNFKLFTIVQRNYNPSFKEAKNKLNLIGKIYNFTYDYELNIESITTGWRAEFDKCFGGVLLDMGYHVLDIIFTFFSGLISFSAVNSFCYDEMKKEGLEDSINIIMRFKNGLSGIININRHSNLKKELFTIRGDKGIIEIYSSQYLIYDRKGRIIYNQNFSKNQEQIKLSMFEFFFRNKNNKDFLYEHFKHHSYVVSIIEKIYRQLKENN